MSPDSINATTIEAIPPAVLKTIPAAAPPPGIQPDFAHPATTFPQIVAVCSTFLAIALTCYTIRIYTKAKIVRRWSWDDLTITLGFSLGIIVYGFFLNGAAHGASSRHLWEVHLDRVLSRANLLQDYWTLVFSQPSLAFVKGSLFIQYYNIFHQLRWFRIAIWIGATIHCVAYITIVILSFALASPRRGEDWLATILSKHYLSLSQSSIPVGAIGLAIDIYLFVLPIPAVLRLQMSISRKLSIIVVFTTGGLALIASATCFVYRIKLQIDSNDTTWKVAYLLMCSQVEILAGVTVSCMPSVKHFSKHFSESPLAKSISRPSVSSFTRLLRKSVSQGNEEKSMEDILDLQRSYSASAVQSNAKTDVSTIQVTRDFTVVREL